MPSQVWCTAVSVAGSTPSAGTPARRTAPVRFSQDAVTHAAAMTGRRASSAATVAAGQGWRASGAMFAGCRRASGPADVPYRNRRSSSPGQLAGPWCGTWTDGS